jgi:hypothetical protein
MTILHHIYAQSTVNYTLQLFTEQGLGQGGVGCENGRGGFEEGQLFGEGV